MRGVSNHECTHLGLFLSLHLFISSYLFVSRYLFASPRTRGGWRAPTGALVFYCRACEARPPRPGATGTPLGAPPWRFSAGDPRCWLPAVGHRSRNRLPAPDL